MPFFISALARRNREREERRHAAMVAARDAAAPCFNPVIDCPLELLLPPESGLLTTPVADYEQIPQTNSLGVRGQSEVLTFPDFVGNNSGYSCGVADEFSSVVAASADNVPPRDGFNPEPNRVSQRSLHDEPQPSLHVDNSPNALSNRSPNPQIGCLTTNAGPIFASRTSLRSRRLPRRFLRSPSPAPRKRQNRVVLGHPLLVSLGNPMDNTPLLYSTPMDVIWQRACACAITPHFAGYLDNICDHCGAHYFRQELDSNLLMS
jgi:hypothetical protein